MVFCRWLEHKEQPELRSDPEDSTEFDQRNHDEVKERRAIELATILTGESVPAEHMLSRNRPSA